MRGVTLDLARRSGGSPRVAAAVGAALLDRDLLADEVLVDRLGGLLDELLRERVLDRRRLALDGRRADRERQLDGLDDPVEEQVRFADFSSFESCSASVSARRSLSNCSRTGPSTAARRCLLEDERRGSSAPASCRTMSSSVESIESGGAELRPRSPRRPRRPRAGRRSAIRSRIRAPCCGLELLGRRSASSHFGLPAWRAELLLRLAELPDLARARARAPRGASSSGTSFAPASTIVRPSFVPTTIRSSSDSSSISCSVGLTTSSPSISPMRTAPTGPRNGSGEIISAAEAPLMQRMSCGGDQVGREHGADDLHLVAEALRPERPDRAVDHARGQDRALGRAALALEEAAGDLPGGVHPLLDVDREREEVRALARLRAALRGREDHRVAGADDDCAVGLLGELARLERDLRRRRRHAETDASSDAIMLMCSSSVLAETEVEV